VGLESAGDIAVGRIEAESDRLGVLICRIEGVAQVHEEGVAAPPKAVFDVRVGEASSVEEVGGGEANGVAGPREQVPVSQGNVEDFVHDMT
jgi:hypothetical protein